VTLGFYLLRSTWSRQVALKARHIRQKLPIDLDTWRSPGNSHEAEEKVWEDLYEVFQTRGITLWPHAFMCTLKAPNYAVYPLASGFAYVTPSRGIDGGIATASKLRSFSYINPLTRIGRTQEGHDVAIRVIVIGDEGHTHLNILRKIATGAHSLLSNNHALPMLAEFNFEDIIFGLFPKAGGSMKEAFDYWAKNSVGDVVEMLMQALEVGATFRDISVCDAMHFY